MKKLTGMKKNFSSLENKKLNDLSTVIGGRLNTTNERSQEPTMGSVTPGNSDSAVYIDGVKKFTIDQA